MMELTINEAMAISQNAFLLSSCPVVPFELAVKINQVKKDADVLVTTFKEEIELIRERGGADEIAQCDALIFKKYEVVIRTLDLSEFDGLEINGEKDVKVNDAIIKRPYRDAYFFLLDKIITAKI
ncbi:hypothetical protein [Mucilaginibacter sp.]|uniref:hypothetical protein n=1 Tax=Mucilaginibacter sp. TaxID=1882438 RepID=UPI000CB5CD9C|nr:hypothetical protein [Mucilaginibacter sp.]PLW89978.1 MAG: hypothetical protein C0154_08625 [Mucilaginibacter sp.]PMP65772.1 MAG: hypothetical protein C0191_02615 [Mucilaginibacter sp.]